MEVVHGLLNTVQPLSAGILAVVVYSLFINCMFGHRTYWRSAENMRNVATKAMRRWYPVYYCWTWSRSGADITPVTIDLLQEDVALCIIAYLHPQEILQVMQTSSSLERLCKTPYLWEGVLSRHLQLLQRLPRPVRLPAWKLSLFSSLPPYQAFFVICKHFIFELTSSYNECCVTIRGSVYDLTDFRDSHPGGAAIVDECKGTDASFEFSVANHSWSAQELAKSFVVVSHAQLFGQRGLPAFAVRYLHAQPQSNLRLKAVPR